MADRIYPAAKPPRFCPRCDTPVEGPYGSLLPEHTAGLFEGAPRCEASGYHPMRFGRYRPEWDADTPAFVRAAHALLRQWTDLSLACVGEALALAFQQQKLHGDNVEPVLSRANNGEVRLRLLGPKGEAVADYLINNDGDVT